MELSSKILLALKYLTVPVEQPMMMAPSMCCWETCSMICLTHLMQALQPQTRQRKMLLVMLGQSLHWPMYWCSSVSESGILMKRVSRLMILSSYMLRSMFLD